MTEVLDELVDWKQVARRRLHPIAFGVLTVLAMDGGRTLSPNQLRYELQAQLGHTAYHTKMLAEAGLLELADVRQVRGASEHFYRLALGTLPQAPGAAKRKAGGSIDRTDLPRSDA